MFAHVRCFLQMAKTRLERFQNSGQDWLRKHSLMQTTLASLVSLCFVSSYKINTVHCNADVVGMGGGGGGVDRSLPFIAENFLILFFLKKKGPIFILLTLPPPSPTLGAQSLGAQSLHPSLRPCRGEKKINSSTSVKYLDGLPNSRNCCLKKSMAIGKDFWHGEII